MSGHTPASRLRTKTADFSDFLRGHGSRPPPASDGRTPSPPPSATLTPESSSASKAKKSRIPFLGRGKKVQSSGPSPSPAPRNSTRKSRDSGRTPEMFPTTSRSGETGASLHPPPLPSAPSPLNLSSSSLGSKFAAHFAPSKSRTRHVSFSPRKPPKLPKSPTSPKFPPPPRESSSLAPSASHSRDPSVESHRSSTSQTRSPTPRASRPTITVSVSPPVDDNYSDLFTLPRDAPNPPGASMQMHLPIPPFESSDSGDDTIEAVDTSLPSRTPPSSPHTQFSSSPPGSMRQSQSPLQRHHSVTLASSRSAPREPSSFLPRLSTDSAKRFRRHPSAVKDLDDDRGIPVDIDPAEESDDNRTAENDKGQRVAEPAPALSSRKSPRKIPGPLYTLPYKTSPSASPRSPSFKATSGIPKAPSSPPSIPLPPPPTHPSSRSSTPSMSTIPSLKSMSSNQAVAPAPHLGSGHRPRASTSPSMPLPFGSPGKLGYSSQPPSPRVSSLRNSTGGFQEKSIIKMRSDRESIASMTAEQLREVLAGERVRYDLLAEHLLTARVKYEVEKKALEKKVDSLEREARKREREIKGLRWLVMNGTGSGGISDAEGRSLTGSEAPSTTSLDLVTPTTSVPEASDSDKGIRKLKTSDSQGPGVHETEDPSPRLKRSNTMSDVPLSSIQKPGSLTASSTMPAMPTQAVDGKNSLGSDLRVVDLPGLEKGTPGSSLSSSAASSTSSLLLPSLTPTNTVSSGLFAIPESPSPSPIPGKDEATIAAEKRREKEERRASRALRRISAGSTGSTSTSASASVGYASNLNIGRSPTIAQLLNQSPSMEDVLDKLRPFGGPMAPST